LSNDTVQIIILHSYTFKNFIVDRLIGIHQGRTLALQEERSDIHSPETLDKKADQIIKTSVYSAMGAGLVPVPFIDFVAVGGIQLNMTRLLANAYDTPFSKDMVQNLIGILLGTAGPISAVPYLFSLVKALPVVGYGLAVINAPIAFGASTYALGHLFKRHFAEGGTLKEVCFEKGREFKQMYAQLFEEGKDLAARMKKKDQDIHSNR